MQITLDWQEPWQKTRFHRVFQARTNTHRVLAKGPSPAIMESPRIQNGIHRCCVGGFNHILWIHIPSQKVFGVGSRRVQIPSEEVLGALGIYRENTQKTP